MTENPYWTIDNPHGWTAEELGHLEPEMQREVLKAWFHRNFEDPAQSTPHDSSEGGYQYVWGGPYDADEELRSEFEPLGVPDEVIGEVVEEVTRDGLYDWAPTHGRLADRWSDRIDESWYPLPLEEPEIPRPPEEMSARQNVVDRIGALEERLGTLEENPPVVGSNVQPWITEPPPFSTDEYLRIAQSLKRIGAEAGANEPNQSSLDEEASWLKKLAISLGQWLKDRRDAFADGFMKAAGVAAFAALMGLYEQLVQLCQAVFHWASLLG